MGKIQRRDFLKAAALGGASVLSNNQLSAAESTPQVLEGLLIGTGANTLELEIEGAASKFLLSGSCTFWRGGEALIDEMRVGDSVMVRLNDESFVERAWANLARINGIISGQLSDGFLIAAPSIGSGRDTTEMEVRFAPATLFQDFDDTERTLNVPILPEGIVDIIGMQLPDGFIATQFVYARPGWVGKRPKRQGPDEVRFSSQSSAAAVVRNAQVYSYNGYATWFDCGNGAGRCGACKTTRSDQCAWPAMDSCGCCSSKCCDCSKGCKNQVYLSCGKGISVYDPCKKVTKTVYIADCGPSQQGNCGAKYTLCGRTCSNCKISYSAPVTDLTKTTFATFYDPAKMGCFPCTVSVSV